MFPGTYPLQLYRGDTYRWQFTLYDDVAQTMPSDLTGVTPAAQIRDKPGGTLLCAIGCAVTLPNVINGILLASDCSDLPNSAAWDLQLTYSTGDVMTVLAGPVNVTADVTDTNVNPAIPLRRVARR